jgi:hypothetical protein
MSERRMSERRTEEDEEEDRRKIPRFTDHELNRSLKQIHIWFKTLYVLAILAAIFELGWSVTKGLENITQGVFFGSVFISLAVLLWRGIYLIKTFLDNHSVNNLNRVHEQITFIFGFITVISIILYIVSLFSRI